jgi:hypothetical protein
VVSDYLKCRMLLPIAREAARVFERAAQVELAGRVRARVARDAARRLLGEQLRAQFPNGRQCGKCGFGPVGHADCGNLRSHHREHVRRGAVTNNACPRCGWFADNIRDWPKWNGQLPRDSGCCSFQWVRWAKCLVICGSRS